MGTPFIYTTLSVPTVASFPSPNCLQWSGDGHVCVATKTAVYILTPDPGISFDTSSVTHASVPNTQSSKDKPLGWYKTMIEFSKGQAYNWSSASQGWGTVSLGSLDVTLRETACSPSNLTRDAGCVVATLSSNMDLSLWIAAKNHLNGEWIKVQDVTHSLIEWFSCHESLSATAKTLQAQITCIAWSSQPNFGVVPTPVLDGSLLIAGSRAGSLTFMRFDGQAAVQFINSLPVAESWITHLTISSWIMTETGKCEAWVAYGISDGSIGLVKIIQFLQPLSSVHTWGSDFSVGTVFEVQDCQLFEPDKRGITALVWVEVPGKDRILVHCKSGVVHLWSPSTTAFGWSGYRALFLQTQKLSVGSSALHPVSGIHYIRSQDALLLCLCDGSLHVIHDISREPTWSSATGSPVTTESLSLMARTVFVRAEPEEMQYADANRISGMLSYDGSATVLWLHEACRPSDFSYKHEAQHNSMFIMAQLWDDTDDDAVLRRLAETLDTAQMSQVSIHSLRPTLLYLRRNGTLFRLHSRLLEMLRPPSIDSSINVTVPLWQGELDQELREGLRRSLQKHLFGWSDFLSLRLRLAVADFCWQYYSEDPQKQTECGQVAQQILNAVSHGVLRTIIRHLAGVVKVLSSKDVPFISRMVLQALLPDAPPDLSQEALRLSTATNAIVSSEAQSQTNNPNERCPACQVEIPLLDITSAVCSNGHTWARCSITSFILSTPMVRTCSGCSRKAFLPISSDIPPESRRWFPIAAQSWVMEELLEAVHRCLFCGNRFVNIL